MEVEKLLSQFKEKALADLGGDLKAIVLYGSVARAQFDEGRSDLNLLLLLDRIDVAVMTRAQKLCEWWLTLGQPWPLLFTEQEFATSKDAFPIEITDIAAAHRILHGTCDLSEPAIDRNLHRAQLEHELRSKVLRLRQKAIPLLQDRKGLLRLMEDSFSTFLLLLRHALLLKGHQPPTLRRELLDFAAVQGLIESAPFMTILDLRQGNLSPKQPDSVQLFEDYLKQIQALVAAVDAI